MSRERHLVALRHDLIRVARAVGRPEGVAPTQDEYHNDPHRRFSVYAVGKRTGRISGAGRTQWSAAMRRLGLRPASDVRINPREIVADLERVAAECGHPGVLPSPTTYGRLGRWSYMAVYEHLAGGIYDWREVGRRARMRPQRRTNRRGDTRDAVIARIRKFAADRGYTLGEYGPGVRELLDARVVSYSVMQRLFGSGREMVSAAGFKPMPPGNITREIQSARLTKRAA